MADARTKAEAIAQEAYARWLGVRVNKIEPDCARVELPYKEENSNPGRQVQGGVVASALAIVARIAARAGLEAAEPCASGMLSLNVGYLASAVGEAIFAEGRVMRRGKELCYVRSEAANPDGKPLGTATVVYRAAPGIDPAPTQPPPNRTAIDRSGDAVEGIEAQAGALTASPFISGVGMVAEQMKDGRARLRLAHRETNAGEGGAIHGGAIAALIDTCGALSAWSLVKPQRGMRVLNGRHRCGVRQRRERSGPDRTLPNRRPQARDILQPRRDRIGRWNARRVWERDLSNRVAGAMR